MSINFNSSMIDHGENPVDPIQRKPRRAQIQAAGFLPRKNIAAEVIQFYKKNLVKRGDERTAFLKLAFLAEKPPAELAWLIQEGASLKELEIYAQTIEMNAEKEKLLSWLKIVSEKREALPENLDHFALTLGLGYKAANLLVMEQKTEIISEELKNAVVKVPPFLPLGDFELSSHLMNSNPQLFEKWGEFLEIGFDKEAKLAFLEAPSAEEASLAGLKITQEGEALLEEIRLEIIELFKREAYHTPQMTTWLSKVGPEFLIIRSTGKEDSDTNSNAGGNASIPYVKPDKESLSCAIREVIASYFGEKSINQRILSGDRSLFLDKAPFVPVLLQEMVGENLGGVGSKNEDIPRSGVLFTRQTDKAEGVTFIQAGLGNNEGVVSSQVMVDSYFVKENSIHAVVRNKETRFVSVEGEEGKITVEPIKNNNLKLERSQALDSTLILDIKRVADSISEMYGEEPGTLKPMDMEYTVKLKEKGSDKPVIYLLQARPLINTKGEENIPPTYLDLQEIKKIPQENVFSSEVLLDGNAYVRKITDPKSVIFTDDLVKGTAIYLHADNPADKKVIILKKTAPATSHEAVILRPKGVAVAVVSDPQDYAALKRLVHSASEESPFLVDTQRGILVSALCQETSDQIIKQGLVSYPIPLEATIPLSRIMRQFHEIAGRDDEMVEMLIENFNRETDTLIHKLQGRQELLSGVNTRELLDMMATKDSPEAKLALATLLKRLKNRLVMSMQDTEDFRKGNNLPMFQLFEAAVALCQKEIVPALERYPAESLERLYPIKFLDAMIHQKVNENVIGNPSYAQVLAHSVSQTSVMEAAGKNHFTYDGLNGEHLILLHRLSALSFNHECEKNWLQLIGDLSRMETGLGAEFISRLLPLITEAAHLNITDKWLNIVFYKAWEACSLQDPIDRAESMIAEMEKTMDLNKKTLEWIQERAGTLGVTKQGTSNWAASTHAKKYAGKLKRSYSSDLGFDKTGLSDNSIRAIYESSDEFGKLALLQYIHDAVNIYDGIVKTAKGSTSFLNDQEKAVLVGELLKGYFEMMQATFKLIPDSDQEQLICPFNKHWSGQSTFFDAYIENLRNGYEYYFGFNEEYESIGFTKLVKCLKLDLVDASDQFEAGKEFAVDSLVVGSKADLNFSVHWPNNLEEYFTTFHQNMEQIIKLLNTKNGLNANLLSEAAKDFCAIANTQFEQEISFLNLEKGKLHVGYQIPLRQHSASFVISYDPKKPDSGLDLKIQIFGNDESNRWDWAASFGSVLAYTLASGFAEDTPPQLDYLKPEGITFTLKIPPNFKDGTKLVGAVARIMNELTFNGDGKPTTLLKYMQTGGKGTPYFHMSTYEGIGNIDWEVLDPECFKYTLHINAALIEELMRQGKKEAAAKVAINSIRGLAYYGVEDYFRILGVSLIETAVDELKKLMTEPAIAAEIQVLIADPDVQSMPNVCRELEQELKRINSTM